MPTPQLSVASRSARETSPTSATSANTGGRLQVPRSRRRAELDRHHPLEVGGEAAAGHVRHRVDAAARRQRPGTPWRRCGSARGAPRPGCDRGRRRPGPAPSRPSLSEHVAHQRVAVGVQAAASPSRARRRRGGPGPGRAARRPPRRRWRRPRRRTRRARAVPGARRSRRRSARSRRPTQASAMPLTIAAIRSGTTRPVAM